MAAEVLIKKGKRGTAAYVQSACITGSNLGLVKELFDIILDPAKPLDDWDTTDWCRWLIAGGKTPDEYAQIVRKYDNATMCGLVWTANFVAYRCRTCGISPCMSLCAECFQRGNHEGHDFNMFRSQAGGACDCGDKYVMKESGFCQRHGSKLQRECQEEAPRELLCVAEAFLPRLFQRLIQQLRDYYKPGALERQLTGLQEADGLLTMLHQHSEMGAAMREVMTQALICPIPKGSAKPSATSESMSCESDGSSGKSGQKGSVSLLRPYFTDLYTTSIATISACTVDAPLPKDDSETTFLEDLVYWTIKYEFPQKLVCLLLNMMPNKSYKEAFTKTFVHHYNKIGKMLAEASDSDTLANRVVHVSVQLFSNQEIAYKMTKEYRLLHVLIKSLIDMLSDISRLSTLQCPDRNCHLVVDCSHRIMKEHCYWPLVSDMNNVLTHKPVALQFLGDASIVNMWFSFLSLFQGMNVNQRELEAHVEFESNTYYAAFSVELEASATPMWALISHLTGPETLHLTKLYIEHCLIALVSWCDATGFSHDETINPYQVTFHLPLHRCYGAFICQAVAHQGAKLADVIAHPRILRVIMMHPLQAQVAFYEVLNGLWVRSGLQIKGQAMTYIQCHFCNSIVDFDLFLLQLCATHLDPDWFLRTVLERFHVLEWFSFNPDKIYTFLEPEQAMPMLESALNFFTMLLAIRTNIGQSDDVGRQEMVSLLCMSDRTHSQLIDMLPDKCGSTSQNKDFERILAEVAMYKAPNFQGNGTMLQGTYVPKPEIWEEEYDPVHVLLRAVQRRDYQSSLDRYTEHLKKAGKCADSGLPWPPYRIPKECINEFPDPRKILHSKTMHSILFTILYRALKEPDVPEQVLSMCIYLLEMAVRFPNPSPTESEINQPTKDLDYGFSSNDTLTNISVPIKKIIITNKAVMSVGMFEEMEVEEEDDLDAETEDDDDNMDFDVQSSTYDVQSPVVEEDAPVTMSHELSDTQLALPSSSTLPATTTSALVPVSSSSQLVVSQVTTVAAQVEVPSTSLIITEALAASLPSSENSRSLRSLRLLPLESTDSGDMAIVPTSVGVTTMRPRCLRFKNVPGRHRMLLMDKGLPQMTTDKSETSLGVPSKNMSFSNKRSIEVNESILSLLIGLHSKLSGTPDSYKSFEERNVPKNCDDSRIGTGVDFISRLLDRISLTSAEKESEIKQIRQRLFSNIEMPSSSKPKEGESKEERRRRAKERQQKLMAEFASKQKAFWKNISESETLAAAEEAEDEEEMASLRKEYECVICGHTAVSDDTRPMGVVTLLQATSVLGNFHKEPQSARCLPCSDEERFSVGGAKTLAHHMEHRIDNLKQHFDNKYWQLAVNIGWEGGVHVQSCGHYLHLDCHKSYIQSLKNLQSSRHQTLNVDRGEYSCPLCRQLANSVIPLNPTIGQMGTVVRCRSNNLHDLAAELSEMMVSSLSEWESNILKVHMHNIMEDLTNSTYPQYRAVCSPNSSSVFLFVCSIARTNLEIELLQKDSAFKQKSCFVPLFHVLSLHSRFLTQAVPTQIWTQLTGQAPDDNQSSVAVLDAEVPLLLRDCIAILLQIILTLPLNIDKVYFNCVVQVLYNVVVTQAVVQLSFGLIQCHRKRWKIIADATFKTESDSCIKMNRFSTVIGQVIENFEQNNLYLKDEDMTQTERTMKWTPESLEYYIQALCLRFLRVAAVLQCHLYNEEMPKYQKDTEDEFIALTKHLGLVQRGDGKISGCSCLHWATTDPCSLIKTWCSDYANFYNTRSVFAAKTLLLKPLVWYPPALLRLPHNYDQIFQYHHRRPCSVCHSVPKDPSLCLVCGTMVCLRENCCKQQNKYEAVLHSVVCGAGTALYLAVNSSTIIVIRGKRACLWGSVYLDSYGEEDRDLKRGKPLYLCEERYNLLENQWLSHSFNHTNKRWVWHKDNL